MEKVLEIKANKIKELESDFLEIKSDIFYKLHGINYIFINPFYLTNDISIVREEDGTVGYELLYFIDECLKGNLQALFFITYASSINESHFPVQYLTDNISNMIKNIPVDALLSTLKTLILQISECTNSQEQQIDILYFAGLITQLITDSTIDFSSNSNPNKELLNTKMTSAALKKYVKSVQQIENSKINTSTSTNIFQQLTDAITGYYLHESIVTFNQARNTAH